MNTIIFAILLSITVSFVIRQILVLMRKSAMTRSEEALKQAGVSPYGASLSHGMVVTKNGKGVKHDSKPSATWYSRLA